MDNRIAVCYRLYRLLFTCGIGTFLLPLVGYAQEEAAEAAAQGFWLWEFLGRLHPLAVHFPVALVLLAAVVELFTIGRPNSTLRPAIRIALAAGAATAVLSVIFGLLLARNGDYAGDTFNLHLWAGIATPTLGVVALLLYPRPARRPAAGKLKLYRSLLFISSLGIAVTGHYGASLTHGEDYLSSTLPWHEGYQEQKNLVKINFASFAHDSAQLSPEQQSSLQLQVKTIFAHNCYKCHGSEKVKGDLRLDNKDMIFRGGESGPLFVPGNPEESELYRRITLPSGHKDVMPPKGKKLSGQDIDVLNFWIQQGAPWPDESDDEKVFRTAALEPRNPELPASSAQYANPIDRWVDDYFKQKNINWPALVDDRVYLRRIYLDIIGLLPSPEELEAFAGDTRPDKRAIWVRQLLDRKDDYAIHWLTFWNDALRNDYTGTGYITGGRFDITNWLYQSLRENKPYDVFVRELINPGDASKGFIKGIRWRGVVNASQTTEIQAAQNVAQVFLGLNLKCASCHNSFINNWKLEDAYAFANIFSDTSIEISRCDKPTGKYTSPKILWNELGYIDSSAGSVQKQAQLAAAMTQRANGRLYRTIVNRIWAQLMGRGLVEPVDVMDNEPWSQDLLDWLAYRFAEEENFDLKELIYRITTSQTYQLPSVGLKEAGNLTSSDFVFSGMVRRRMSAEQFSDAVGKLVWPLFGDSVVRYDPYKNKGVAREPGYVHRASLVQNNQFLVALGRPNRETVSTGRESQANLLQALELTNGEQFSRALQRGAREWKQKYPQTDDLINAIYREVLLRAPRAEELTTARQVLGEPVSEQSVEDLLWALLLLPEFQLIY